jgi:hypothetical protein
VLAATVGRPDMRALYLRNVPVDVADRLTQLARRERLSVDDYVVRELTALAERARTPASRIT